MTAIVPDLPRRCLRVDEWPTIDQSVWIAATTQGDVLDGSIGRAAQWRAPTLEKVRKGYGRWLCFLISSGRFEADALPTDRITPAAVEAYVRQLQQEIATWTVWTYVVSLHQVAMAFADDVDWGWLYRLTTRLKTRRRAIRQKLQKLRPASEIADWAYQAMGKLQTAEDRTVKTAISYRNALLIGLLINCPMRLRNLAMIQIGKHLRQRGVGYVLEFKPDEVKTNRYLTLHVAEAVTPYLESWINEWRPILQTDPEESALWLGIKGHPLKGTRIYWCICDGTKGAFGTPINPHLFRDCAATTVAIEDPKHIGITAPVLGHLHPKTTEDHYIHANQLIAVRHYRNSIDLLRKQSQELIGGHGHSESNRREGE
jgi:integrase/recombinase XerD